MTDNQLAFDWHDDSPHSDHSMAVGMPSGIQPLAERLRWLAAHEVYLGTSSWKYPGWLGKAYRREHYVFRKKFSAKRFNDTCLEHYSQIFPTVCGDFVFYQFPSETVWERTFSQLPAHYRFSMKIPEDLTVERFPKLPRYGRRAGTDNPLFMRSDVLSEKLLSRLEPYREQLGVLIFEFGTLHDGPMSKPEAFSDALEQMLSTLPTDRYRFAVEVRNPAFLLEPTSPYLSALRGHNVAHCLNSWTHMPAINEQMKIADIFTASHIVARFLLRPGRNYQQAVEQFQPYEHIQDPYPEGRSALQELIESFTPGNNALYAFVNNRFEGNAIETIELATDGIDVQ